ncbi:MAG TPA: cupin domain-containing protein [Hyphomicrobiaceae bacterium]|nr:cupin domain-containing protein [Hyphomicrobiaceae bacterium]
MSSIDIPTTGEARIIGPEDGASFWQPVPANGFVRNILNQAMVGGNASFSMGTQTVAPGCFIREHTHAREEEIIHVLEGEGIARVEGIETPISRGSTVFIGCNRRHHFLNRSASAPFTFLWLMLPGGLDRFFAEIGRPRTPGDPTPAPFPRPDNIAEIERRTVFGWTDKSYDKS